LDLSFNAITGTLPPEFETLGIVGMDDVLLNDNFLTGSIPTLNALDTLYLHNNTFSGEIPSYVWNLSISGLRLDDNDLYGEVSESFCSNLSFFEGYEDVYDLTVDDSSWFLDEPLVTCPCCDDANCHLWDAETIIVGGTVSFWDHNKSFLLFWDHLIDRIFLVIMHYTRFAPLVYLAAHII